MSEPAVEVGRRGATAVLTLNRPRNANAFSAEMRAALFAAKQEIAADPDVRTVIVTGAGAHFCAGADLRESPRERALARRRYPGAADLSGLPQPVIAAINGAALGGGCEMALTCDFRFLAEHAKVGLTEIRFGALPLGGGTARLPRLVGLSAARRMIMTGEPVDADEAYRIGLADRVVPAADLLAAAEEFAALLAEHAGYATRTAKRLLNATLEVDLPAALELERTLVRGMATGGEHAAAQAAAARNSRTYARIFDRAGAPAADPAMAGDQGGVPELGGSDPPAVTGPDGSAAADGGQLTGHRQREAWLAGELPPVEQVRPGLWSLPVVIPRSQLRYVLAYALELPDGVALVDAGWDADVAWEQLVEGLSTAGFAITDVRAVLATHIHGDHYGLAGRIRAASGAWIGLHPADAEMIGSRDDEATRADLADRWARLHRRIGAPGQPPAGRVSERQARKYITETRPDVLLRPGVPVDLPGWPLVPVWTPGHSPGHVCFLDERRRLLFGGDHVLPRITPNVSMHSRQRANPLGDYLDSLAAVRDFAVDEVLPAHEYRFTGLPGRVDALLKHHGAKLAEIEELLTGTPGASCWSVCARLTWARPFATLDPAARHVAARETLAHLALLESRGRAWGAGEAPRRWYAGSREA